MATSKRTKTNKKTSSSFPAHSKQLTANTRLLCKVQLEDNGTWDFRPDQFNGALVDIPNKEAEKKARKLMKQMDKEFGDLWYRYRTNFIHDGRSWDSEYHEQEWEEEEEEKEKAPPAKTTKKRKKAADEDGDGQDKDDQGYGSESESEASKKPPVPLEVISFEEWATVFENWLNQLRANQAKEKKDREEQAKKDKEEQKRKKAAEAEERKRAEEARMKTVAGKQDRLSALTSEDNAELCQMKDVDKVIADGLLAKMKKDTLIHKLNERAKEMERLRAEIESQLEAEKAQAKKAAAVVAADEAQADMSNLVGLRNRPKRAKKKQQK